jgi:hypothetical protein
MSFKLSKIFASANPNKENISDEKVEQPKIQEIDSKKVYEDLKEPFFNQPEALRNLIFTLDLNQKNSKTAGQNILLLGEYGGGKTTLVKKVAQNMNIPLVISYNMFDGEELNLDVFANSINKLIMQNDNHDLKGIVLIHDMEKAFINDMFEDLSSLLSYNVIIKVNGKELDFSNVTFIGEINNDTYPDVFPKVITPIDLAIEQVNDSKCVNPNELSEEQEENLSNEQIEKLNLFLTKQDYLSRDCMRLFKKRIYMERLTINDVIKIMDLPFSQFQIYRNDLDEEYFNSNEFKAMVANQIIQSNMGLNYLSEAIENTAAADSKHLVKVYKPKSLMQRIEK